jgi:hypothetical protein
MTALVLITYSFLQMCDWAPRSMERSRCFCTCKCGPPRPGYSKCSKPNNSHARVIMRETLNHSARSSAFRNEDIPGMCHQRKPPNTQSVTFKRQVLGFWTSGELRLCHKQPGSHQNADCQPRLGIHRCIDKFSHFKIQSQNIAKLTMKQFNSQYTLSHRVSRRLENRSPQPPPSGLPYPQKR